MNKFYINGILVVEGKSDQAKISSFLLSPIIKTNGFDVNKNLINFLCAANKIHKVYLFLDNDASGKKIEAKLQDFLQNYEILTLFSDDFIPGKKKGNAEIKTNKLYDFLYCFKSEVNVFSSEISATYLSLLFLKNKDLKQELIKKYNLIKGNNKYIALQLNILGIKKVEIDNHVDK